MKHNNISNILPSKKVIDLDKVVFVDYIKHVHNWWSFPVKYSDGRTIELVYYSEKGANIDRDYILRNIRLVEKYIE